MRNNLTLDASYSFLQDPRCHIGLLAGAVYLRWNFPNALWTFIPLALSLSGMLLASRHRGVLETGQQRPGSYPLSEVRFLAVGWRLAVPLCLFTGAPLVIAFLGIAPWSVALYLTACASIVARSSLAVPPRDANSRQPHSTGSQLNTAAWFNYCILAMFSFLYALWPFIAAHGASVPSWYGNAIAAFERGVNAPTRSALATLALSEVGNSYGVETRSGMTSLAGNSDIPTCLLFSLEQVHAFLFLLLLTGSVLSAMLLERPPRWRSMLIDSLALAITFILYTTASWWDVLAGRLPPTTWPDAGLGAIVIVVAWWSARTCISLVPPLARNHPPATPFVVAIPALRSIASLTAALIVVGGAVQLWHDPGIRKPGRIVIDEFHSEWEKSDLPMETEYYGVKTVYNYAFLKEILEKHFAQVTTNNVRISSDVLRDCDVLILKTPTSPYRDAEIQAVHEFVERGGGLWLIGDHTNIFGMNTYLNQVSSAWGIHFNADAVSPVPDFYQRLVHVADIPAVHAKCGKRSHENLFSKRYLNHPILGHHIPYLTVLTSCSVTAPLASEYVTISRGTYSDHARFGGNTFFGNLEYDPDERYGCILQNVAHKEGKGRVALWSDSTLFSNFSMCMTGVPQLALGYVHWLNRSNAVSSEVYNTVRLAIVALFLGVAAMGRRRPNEIVVGVLLGGLLLTVSVPALDYCNGFATEPFEYREGFKTVGFDQQYSQIELPDADHVHADDVEVFEGLYVLMQRLHLMPFSAKRLASLATSDVIVIVNPKQDITASDVERLRDALQHGRSVMLLLGWHAQRKDAVDAAERHNRILESLDLSERFVVTPASVLTDLFGELTKPAVITDVTINAHVDGAGANARVLLSSGDGTPAIVQVKCMGGTVVLGSIADLYSNVGLGEPTAVPTFRQAQLLSSTLRLMSYVVDVKTDKALSTPWSDLIPKSNSSSQ
jgi:hypothetical protein